MANSAEYQILLALKSALEGVTVANGYNTDVALVDLYERFHDDVPVFPAIAIATLSADEDQTRFADYNEVNLRVGLTLMVEQYTQEHRDVAQFVGDVRDRLFSELPDFLGGLSKYVRFNSVDYIHWTEEDPRAGALVVITIFYRHPIQDSFTLIP